MKKTQTFLINSSLATKWLIFSTQKVCVHVKNEEDNVVIEKLSCQ